MVLVVVGVLVWKFSTTFQTHERPAAFSDFMADVDSGKVEQVTIAGHEIAGIYRTDTESFRTYAPSQYDGLARKLIERGISVTATAPTQISLTCRSPKPHNGRGIKGVGSRSSPEQTVRATTGTMLDRLASRAPLASRPLPLAR